MKRIRSTPILAFPLVALVVTIGACSSDNNNQSSSNTTGGQPGTTALVLDDQERLAAAKTATVQFFEAQAVNAYAKALEASTGAAAVTIQWAQGVNSVQAAEPTPYVVPTVQAPNVRVEIDHLEETASNHYRATGFVELGQRPGPIGSTSTSSSSSTSVPAPTKTYVTDLDFVQSGTNVDLADYRLDDTPYPVSELFITLDGSTEGQGITAKGLLAHRDIDGSVQYLLDTTGNNATLEAANFVQGSPGTTRPPSTGAPTTGTPATVFADSPSGDDAADALIVRPGAFPGSAGTLLLGFGAAADAVTLDLVVPDFPPLTPRPTNTVRDSQTSGSSTSSSSSSSSTSSSSSSTSSSTSTPASSSTTTTRPPSSTTSAPSSTTTASSTTTTSTAGLASGGGGGY